MPNLLNVNICGIPTVIDPWELMHWITLKFLTGCKPTATIEHMGKIISGQLRPHSIDRTQEELTRSCLVELRTEEGTFIFNCKHLKEINLSPLSTLKN